jgi:hypothetical protein
MKMRVSFDLDGTAWRYRRFFTELAVTLQGAGHEVGVLTAHAEDLAAADLRLWRARGFPEPDFFYNQADIRKAVPDEHDLRTRKVLAAATFRIDCHIDDFDDRHPGELELVLIGQRDESRE